MATSRFADMSEDEMEGILNQTESRNTKSVLQVASKLFEDYINNKLDLSSDDLIEKSTEDLVQILKKFYCNMRKRNGEPYAKKTMISIRYGLQKKIEKSHKIDIVNNTLFKKANNMFQACMKKLKIDGIGETKHKDAISEEDMKKLYSTQTLGTQNPKSLQNKVFFELMMFLCNRGRENLRSMTRNDFIVNTDASGRRYVVNVKPRLTKNHRGGTDDVDDGGGRMYEKPGSPHCPVLSYEKYLAKLHPDCQFLWQRPKHFENKDYDPPTWYDNMVLGKNTLGQMMQRISNDADLSQIYSNHCIRATCITLLDESGYEGRHIMTVSKHKSEASLKHYVSKAREKKKREMSTALAEQVLPQEIKSATSSSTVNTSSSTDHKSAAESNGSDMINLENVDLLELNSQEMNNMMMTVFGQTTTVTETVNKCVPVCDNAINISNVQEVSTKGNVCPRYNFTNCKIVINDYGGQK